MDLLDGRDAIVVVLLLAGGLSPHFVLLSHGEAVEATLKIRHALAVQE